MTETQKIDTIVGQLFPPSAPEMPTFDLEKTGTGGVHSVKPSTSMAMLETETLDIEHVPVENDPRKWSPLRKASFQHKSPILSTTFDLPCFCVFFS